MPDMPTLFRHTRLAATDQDEAFDTEGYETLRNDRGEFLLNHQGIYTLRDSHGERRLAANLLDKGEQVWGKPFVPQHTLLETMNQESTIDAHTLLDSCLVLRRRVAPATRHLSSSQLGLERNCP